MGWAKYREDDLSICVARMANYSYKRKNPFMNRALIQCVKSADSMNEGEILHTHENISDRNPSRDRIRNGLILRLPCNLDASVARKLRVNGWWHSKAQDCWCNTDTEINRQYALSVVALIGGIAEFSI